MDITVANGGRVTTMDTEGTITVDHIEIMNNNRLIVAGTMDQAHLAPQMTEIGDLKDDKTVKAALR